MRILYVEDDAMNRFVVRDMLEVGGVEMSEADNAEAGHRMIDAENFDVVLMDLRMPGTDGLTAIKQIRMRTDAKARIPVIVITADTAPGLRAVCIESGANGLLLKPVVMQELFEAVGRAVSGQLMGIELSPRLDLKGS